MVLDWRHGLASGWFCGDGTRGDTFWDALVWNRWQGICQW